MQLSPSFTCSTQGCQIYTARAILKDAKIIQDQAQRLIRSSTYGKNPERTRLMSEALWCDRKEHPFSKKDPDRKHFTQSTFDALGNEEVEELDFCGDCAKEMANKRTVKAKTIVRRNIVKPSDDDDDDDYRDDEMY